MTRARAGLVALPAAAVVAGLVWAGGMINRKTPPLPRVTIQPDRILADGYDTSDLFIETTANTPPQIAFSDNVHGVAVLEISRRQGGWHAQVRAGVMPGRIGLRIEFPGYPQATGELTLLPDTRDSAGDGTPDSVRLDDPHDRHAFRRWFTWLAEAQYFEAPSSRPAEISDCSALIRYAYREALRAHDSGWARASGLRVIPAFDSVAKYRYPHTVMDAGLFRVRPGPFRLADVRDGAFLQFADARTLWRYNTHFLSRDMERGLPGDLLFFRQESARVTYHSMIFLGASQMKGDGRYIVYHTGPEGEHPGEMRRLGVEELMQFPQAEWRPVPSNPSFLGVARWNILRTGERESDARRD